MARGSCVAGNVPCADCGYCELLLSSRDARVDARMMRAGWVVSMVFAFPACADSFKWVHKAPGKYRKSAGLCARARYSCAALLMVM
jgi:hypothetical protein